MLDASCIFCKIVLKQIPAKIIKETDDVLVFQDIAPQAPIHYLFIPKIHVQDFSSLVEQREYLFAKIAHVVREVAQELPAPHHYKLVTNNGYSAGQRVFHLHFHFLAGQEF